MTHEGDLIANRYRLVSLVGQGGMGVVWRARDERLDRVVAVKQLLPDATADEAMQRASREARVAARLRHPHAVMVHDVVEHEGKPCLVMEFVDARTLAELMAQRGTLDPVQVARIGAQLAAALAAAHESGIVHRDVKPGNVLLTGDDVAKIADFGISRAVGEGTVTGHGLIAGTPAFLSPEVASGEEAAAASDVYSLGATLYAAVEGAPPSGDSDNPLALLARIAAGTVTPPARSGPLADVLLAMLRRAPAERPTMAEVRSALDAVADGEPAQLPPPRRDPTLVLPARQRPSRRTVVVGTLAAGLLAAGVAIGVLIAQDEPGGRAAPGPATTTTPVEEDPACSATYEVTGAWPGGYQVEVTVRAADDDLTGWEVTWELPDGEDIDGVWNGTLSRDGSSVTVTDAGWNAMVSGSQTATFGFNGSRTTDADPAQPALKCRSR